MLTHDLFATIRALSSIKKVSNFYVPEDTVLDLVFFVCPRLTGNGLKVNKLKTGFAASYRDGISEYSRERFERVDRFCHELQSFDVNYRLTAIFAAADSMMLFPIPAEPPNLPSAEFVPQGFKLLSNLEIYASQFQTFAKLYRDSVWQKAPPWAIKMERDRLAEILPRNIPDNISEDFINRCFAGFALDGLILRQGYFGQNPVILGVETPGVSVLQNIALERSQWLPVIDLV